jgi:hypothetical protein
MEIDKAITKHDEQSLKDLWSKAEEANSIAEKINKTEYYIQKVMITLQCVNRE